MLTVHVGSEETSVQGSPWALFIYQREFAEGGKKADWYADYERAYSKVAELPTNDDGTFENPLKFIEAIDALFLLKTAWAMAKNADDATPPFEEWARGIDASLAPIAPWKLEVNAAINAELFRFRPAGKGEERADGE